MFFLLTAVQILYKSSAVAEMGDRGTIDIGLKEGGAVRAPFAERWEPV